MRFHLNQFHRGDHGNYAADASELGIKPGVEPFARLFDDACDVGIVIDSPSGKSEKFYLHDTQIIDGEVIAWHYLPANVHLGALKFTIIND